MTLNRIFLFSLLLGLPLLSACQTNSSAPAQPSQPMTSASNDGRQFKLSPVGQSQQAMTSPARPAPAEEANLDFNFNMPLRQFLEKVYAPLVGRTPLRSPNTPTNAFITLKVSKPLTKTDAIEALETVLGMNGFAVVPVGDKFFKVVVTGSPVGLASANASSTMPGNFTTKVVQLKYADPDEMVKSLRLFTQSTNSVIYVPSTESLILRDYTENVKRMLDMVEELDVEPALAVKSQVFPIRGVLAADIAARIPRHGQTKIIADARTNSLLVFANDADMKIIQQMIWEAVNLPDIR
jgi:general secretion pathway protein D